MSSFITVNLDTTKPSVEIYAPNYVATNSIMEVLIVANEDLDIYQDVQMVYGDISTPLIFSQENNKEAIKLTNKNLNIFFILI